MKVNKIVFIIYMMYYFVCFEIIEFDNYNSIYIEK